MNTHELGYNIRAWLAHPLGGEVRSVIQRIGRAEDVRHVAIMPDVHLAEHVCVGAVIATTRTLLPDAVGGDIGCGMAAMAFEAGADVIVDESDAMAILGRLRNVVPTNHHRGPRDARSLPANLRTRIERPLAGRHRTPRWHRSIGHAGLGESFPRASGGRGGDALGDGA